MISTELKSLYYVLGNHDHYHGGDEISNFVKSTYINILNNEVVNFRGLQIVGVPFSWGSEYLPDVLDKIDFDKDALHHPFIPCTC